MLSVQGGGFSPLAHLDEPGNVDFKTGYNVGGGLAYQFNRHVAIRGNFTFARAEGRDIQASLTKGAGKVGVGLNYQIPRSNLGVYVEGTGWLYKWDRYGFDKTQFDTTWSGGISYRFGL